MARTAKSARTLGFELPLVPFVDCLLAIVLFLLASFSASPTCQARERVPSAEHTSPAIEAPVVAVTPAHVLLDGTPVGDTQAILSRGRLTRLDELHVTLRAKRELWRALNPEAEFPGTVVLQIDRDVPALAVKSAFQTAAYAGYPNVAFLVRQR